MKIVMLQSLLSQKRQIRNLRPGLPLCLERKLAEQLKRKFAVQRKPNHFAHVAGGEY